MGNERDGRTTDESGTGRAAGGSETAARPGAVSREESGPIYWRDERGRLWECLGGETDNILCAYDESRTLLRIAAAARLPGGIPARFRVIIEPVAE